MPSAGSKAYVPQMHKDIFQTCSLYICIPEWYRLFTADAEHNVSFSLFTVFNFYTWNKDTKVCNEQTDEDK